MLVVDDDGVGLGSGIATPRGRNSGSASAVVSSNAAVACSSSGREPSAERAP